MKGDGFHYKDARFVPDGSLFRVIDAPSLIALTEESIAEHVEKARNKIDIGDHPGAIASAYTPVEGFLKQLLRRTGTPLNEEERDIRELYKIVAEPLNLNPKGETLESYLKQYYKDCEVRLAGCLNSPTRQAIVTSGATILSGITQNSQ